MSTDPTEHRRTRLAAALLALSVLAAVLGGCGGSGGPGATSGPPAVRTSTSPSAADAGPPSVQVTGLPLPRDLAAELTHQLDARAGALTSGDRPAFTRTLDRASAGFVTAQEGYFDNLRQLPIESLRYRLVPSSLVRSGQSYWVVVEVSLQLAGFDGAPVTSPDRFRFTASGPDGSYRLSSTTDAAWEAANDVRAQPWDLEPIEVRTASGVLGVFDHGTVADAATLLGAVQAGAADVQARVPYGWDGRVVFYALSDDSFLAGLGRVPGGDPQALGGVAFSLVASAQDDVVADTRVVFSPDLLHVRPLVRDRLVRHELTHVAVGAHDDGAPLWLSEGLAEWVSVQSMRPADRRVPTGALADVRAPGLRMPTDASFEGPDAATDYVLGWWACEYLAARLGQGEPWLLLDALHRGSPSGAGGVRADQVQVTRGLLGLTPDQLARRGAKLLLTTYGVRSADGSPRPGPLQGAGGQAPRLSG